MIRIVLATLLSSFLALPSLAARATDVAQREPGLDATGEVYEWTSQEGLAFRYYVPENLSGQQAVNLTFILHGSNLSRKWGFANHRAGAFRPDDVVVSPDGTTANGRGGFNLLDNSKDLRKLHDLHEELRKWFPVQNTYLYGHSQGSFFAFKYAGAYPDDVQGLVGHASGVWIGTQAGSKNHHQAIVLMHGTADPVVPYRQSVGGLEFYQDAKFPLARLRSLQGWNHWPAEHNGSIGGSLVPHTSQQLAWCEGMTSTDHQRIEACFDLLANVQAKEWHDYAALYRLAGRVEQLDRVEDKLQKRARRARAAVDDLAEQHVRAIKKSLGSGSGKSLTEDSWVGHLPIFLRDFAGVESCEQLRKTWQATLDKHKKTAQKHLKDYRKNRERKAASALESAIHAIRSGFFHPGCADHNFLKAVEGLLGQGREIKAKKTVLRDGESLLPTFRKALDAGVQEFMSVNREWRDSP